jgi:hypothetical protein
MDPWMDENLVVFAIGHNCFGSYGQYFFHLQYFDD